MKWWVPLMLIGLAGCASEAPEEADTLNGQPVAFEEVATTAELGGITGVIVDPTVMPAAGIEVTLVGPELTTTTSEEGTFSFSDLAPGLYILQANGTGFLETQSSADVQAGEVTKVKMVIPIDTSPQPFHETFKFDWFDSAGQPLVDFAIDLFVGGGAPRACDQCEWTIVTSAPAETLVIEAQWEDSPAPPPHKDSEFYWTIEPTADSSDYESDYFYSPGLAHINGNRWGDHMEFFLMMAAEEEWVVVDQAAEVFVSFFYVDEAPEGWSFIAGDR